ncbi:Rhodanese-like protein [Hypoxylon sp. FL1284]|nr:Rhodanese-like protein [Hypoxylon sp. FL1284]
MASRRLALSAALRGQRACAAPAARMPRAATFGIASAGAGALRTATRTKLAARPARGAGAVGVGVRWESNETPDDRKTWSFEEIQALTRTPNPAPSPHDKLAEQRQQQSQPQPPSRPPRKHPLLIDVREPSELAETGRIPSSINVPVASAPDAFHVAADEFEARYGVPRPDPAADELVFYCKAGVRSRAAATLARQAGFRRVGEYPGSWLDWVRRGGEVKR